MVFMSVTMNSSGFFYYGIPFYEKIPKYQCQYISAIDTWTECTAAEVCQPD